MTTVNNKVALRWRLLLGALAVLAAILVYDSLPPRQTNGETCLGVEILPSKSTADLGEYKFRDYSDNLKFGGEFAPVDEKSSVIYISQKIGEGTAAGDLNGLLTIDVPGVKLYFAPDENWENLQQAVAAGHGFQLLVSGPLHTYMEYRVVFTTLSVISLHGKIAYWDDEGRTVFSGQFSIWESTGEENGAVAQTSQVQYKVRGATSRYAEKSPWKVSLKNEDGKNRNLDLLGMGSDDDWILNPMFLDDTNVKEMLFTGLWNEMAAGTDYNHQMSPASYVELLVNGRYRGVYLLQRRMDDKYLGLDIGSVAVKVSKPGSELAYQFYSAVHQEVSQTELEAYFLNSDYESLHKENFADINLFLQLFTAGDNCLEKNMYYIFSGPEENRQITMVPWDTDLTLGVVWDQPTGWFRYDYDWAIQSDSYRMELAGMTALHPDLYACFQSRWAELREGVFDLEHMLQQAAYYHEVLNSSGAAARDLEKWGLAFDGEDTVEQVYQFLEERITWMDETFASNTGF